MSSDIHIFISIATFAILGLAALQAILLYIQNQLIRYKGFQQIAPYLPPLQTMEKRLFQMTWLGFLLLSCSLLSAFLYMEPFYASVHLHKILFSLLAWAFFAILLFGHHKIGWRGLTAVRWTLSAVALLIVAYFSSKLMFLS